MEKWRVVIGRDERFIDGFQAEIIRLNMEGGKRSHVHFDGISFSIPHIELLELVEKKHRQTAEEKAFIEKMRVREESSGLSDGRIVLTEEERQKRIEWFKEKRKELVDKGILSFAKK